MEIAHELNDFVASLDPSYMKHSFGALCHYYRQKAGLVLREDVETVLELSIEVGTLYVILILLTYLGA